MIAACGGSKFLSGKASVCTDGNPCPSDACLAVTGCGFVVKHAYDARWTHGICPDCSARIERDDAPPPAAP